MVFCEVVLLRMVDGGVSVSDSESESESSESEELEEVLELESEELLEEEDEEDEDIARFLVLCFATVAFSEKHGKFLVRTSKFIKNTIIFSFSLQT
jgi:hypothetical protein